MSIFRRKTDQVYATLQQVQRRITAQTGVPLDNDVVPRSVVSPGSLLLPLGRPAEEPQRPSLGEPPTASIQPKTDVHHHTGGQRRNVLHLSGELAIFLVVLWMLTVTIAYFIGHSKGKTQAVAGVGNGFAAGPAGNRTVDGPAAAGRGNWIFVLENHPRATPELEQSLLKRARELNDVCRTHADRGYKPWFDVRRPTNGTAQLIFGSVDGQLGINRDEFQAFVQMVIKDRPDFRNGTWLMLTPTAK